MHRISNIIKTFDIFGRPLHLNFNKQWNTHDTSLGGISTGIMIVFTLIYTGVLINIMINYSQNTTRTLQNELYLADLGLIQLNETNVLFFSWIYGKNLNPNAPIEDVLQYVDIYFEEQTFDFNYGLNSSVRRIPVKWCTQKDFGMKPKDVINF